ncbi:MAG: glycosyltransferase family 4 protein [Propionibacterium sp.]|nr:glycosyltransferase family 4 protein [Propionibacterium sp.]
MSSRIALVVPEYRTDVAPGGGVSTVAEFVYFALAAVPDWKVEVFSPRMWSGAPESQRIRDPRSWLKGPTVRVGRVGGVRVTYVGSHFAEIELLRYRSRRVLRELLASFDLILVVSGTPAVFEIVRGVRVPLLAQVATTADTERERIIMQGNILQRIYRRVNCSFVSRLDRRGVRRPDLILVENARMEDWCRAHGARNVRIEPPGIDTDFYAPDKVASQPSGYILSVGRLGDPRKDFGLLLRAYAHAICNAGLTQRLVIAGRGDLPAAVHRTLEELDIDSRVEVRSNLSPRDLRDAYRGAALFAMSSSEEGLGMVLIEALACGVPIVSTATEGAKSVVAIAGTGDLVEFGDDLASRLGSAMARLVADSDERKRRSEQARAAAVEHFGLHGTSRRFREAVRSLLSTGH